MSVQTSFYYSIESTPTLTWSVDRITFKEPKVNFRIRFLLILTIIRVQIDHFVCYFAESGRTQSPLLIASEFFFNNIGCRQRR